MKNESILNRTRDQYISSRFISESFKKTCEGAGFESLNQWQITCRALWKLDYIGWSNAKDFLVLPENFDNELFYGTWKSELGNGEIYATVKEK